MARTPNVNGSLTIGREGSSKKGCAGSRLPPESEIFDKTAVSLELCALEVFEQLASTTDHAQQTTTGVMVGGVLAEMIGQMADLLREEGDLDFR